MKYRTIVADPPWPYPGGFKHSIATGRDDRWEPGTLERYELPYPAMSLDEIRALPLPEFAERDGCCLFLWTTNAYLRFGFDLLDAWGFRYGQTLVWHKVNAAPWAKSVAPNSADFILVGSVGSPGRSGRFPSAVIPHGVPKTHSRKPDIFTDLIEQVSPGPYLEMFARRQRLGWDTWGNECFQHVELDS